ncbi:MAG: hypothetical protein AAF418_06730, partial [Pseudomonadota bacterium]
EPYQNAIEQNGLTVDQFADFVQRAASAAKYNASTRAHLLDLLAALKIAVLKVTELKTDDHA